MVRIPKKILFTLPFPSFRPPPSRSNNIMNHYFVSTQIEFVFDFWFPPIFFPIKWLFSCTIWSQFEVGNRSYIAETWYWRHSQPFHWTIGKRFPFGMHCDTGQSIFSRINNRSWHGNVCSTSRFTSLHQLWHLDGIDNVRE